MKSHLISGRILNARRVKRILKICMMESRRCCAVGYTSTIEEKANQYSVRI